MIIKGLRQVGKTYIALDFGKENYENIVYLNFKMQPSLKEAFSGDIDVNTVMLALSLKMPDLKFEPSKTLIIMDEIQECAKARSSLKYFVIDGRYDVLATGSLMGISGYNRENSEGPSVGSERMITMTAMDFEEFLLAKGISVEAIDSLKRCYRERKKIPEAIHNTVHQYYKEYIVVGGMPEAVGAFIESNDFNKVKQVQKDLISSYRDDFGKYISKNGTTKVSLPLKAKINSVLDAMPRLLAKENKTFSYSELKPKGRASTHDAAIQWIKDYGLALSCQNLSKIELPLSEFEKDGSFKLYFADTGLFFSILEDGSADDIMQNRFEIYKGAIFENVVAESLFKQGIPLHYYRSPTDLEIDFVIRYQNKATLMEVKAKDGRTKAAKTILSDKSYGIEQMIKLSSNNISFSNNILSIPRYLSFLLND